MTSDPTSTAQALTLLSEYTQSLDSLPADVSRQFADLRELDAVLSASVHALTTKINRLIEMIESNSSPKEQRIWLLMEISDEAQRLKLGGEDKIRVAAQVADFLKVQYENMTSLLHIPGFNRSIISRHTSYPHVAPRSYAPISMYENGRRRRGAMLGGTATDQANPTNKRRRAAREDDGDPVAGRTPRRDRVGDGTNSRSRNGARSRRFVSLPTEVSILAFTDKTTPLVYPPMEQTRSRGFAHRITPFPLRHLPSAGHLRTCHPDASPKLTQSSSQASLPSQCSLRHSRALCERWRVGSSNDDSGRGVLLGSGRGDVVCGGVRVRIRVDYGCGRACTTCFAIRTYYCRQELVWSRACAARGPRHARRTLGSCACGRSGWPGGRRRWRQRWRPRSWCWYW
jgi:Inhibitor of growth proteins N-terminal histone-binding